MRPEVTANSTTNSASGSNFDQSDDLTSERIANESSMHQESTESIKDEHDLSSESFKLFETCPDDEQLSQNDCVEEDDDNDFCLVNSALEEDSDHLDEEYDDDDVTDSKLANWEKRKMLEIFTAIQENDVERLIRLSDSEGGLLNNHNRRVVWPKLVGPNLITADQMADEDKMKSHVYYYQVKLDVNRSIRRFPPSIREAQRLSMQDQLVRLIMRILIRNPSLHYYQGFHDICVTFLIILGEDEAFYAMNNLVNSHLHRFMEKTTDSVAFILELIPLLIYRKDPILFEFLEKSEVGNIYALSWVLTWFGHSLNSYRQLGRLFDLFIVNHELFVVYLVAAIVLWKRDEILQLDCSLSGVYPYLNKLVEREQQQLPFEKLIQTARSMLIEFSPESLHKEQTKRVRHKQHLDQMHRKKVSKVTPSTGIDRKLMIAASVFAASAFIYVITKNLSSSSNF